MKNNSIRILVLIFTIATIIVSYLSEALPLNDLSTREIADKFNILFVPAPYVFSIWGLIYLMTLVYAIYQLKKETLETIMIDRVGGWFLLTCTANMSWIFLWHYEQFFLALVAIVILLLSLIKIYLLLTQSRPVGNGSFWIVDVTFSLYLGWLTVATISNITSFLDYIKWNGFGISPVIWTYLLLVAGLMITVLIVLRYYDGIFAAVIVWAFIGIGVNNLALPEVSYACFVAAAIAASLMLVGFYKTKKLPQANLLKR